MRASPIEASRMGGNTASPRPHRAAEDGANVFGASSPRHAGRKSSLPPGVGVFSQTRRRGAESEGRRAIPETHRTKAEAHPRGIEVFSQTRRPARTRTRRRGTTGPPDGVAIDIRRSAYIKQ